MKKLFVTVLVIAMIATMFCVSPVVSASGDPEMALTVVNYPSGDDPISAVFTNLNNAKWIVWSVKADSTGEYIYLDEKRVNNAEQVDFTFTFGSEETTLKLLENFTAEAKISNNDGTVTTISKSFTYKSYASVQEVIRDILAVDGDPDQLTLLQGQEELSYLLPSYYSSEVDTNVRSALRTTYASQLSYPAFDQGNFDATNIDPENFYSNMKSEILVATLSAGNAGKIKNLLDSAYTDVGLTAETPERLWYENLDKTAIATKLAGFTYATISDFVNQFKSEVFVAKLSGTYSTEVMAFIESNYSNYTNYGTATHLSSESGTPTVLDFITYNSLVSGSSFRQEYAGTYMAATYANLDVLEERFADLLIALPNINEPVQNTPTGPSVSVGSDNTISVGLVNPIVGENSIPFTDIDDVEWAKEAIGALYREGVIEGVSAKQFQPNSNVTREQFVKIIVNTFGLKGNGTATSLTDVDQSAWYASFINTAVELGIINGVSDTAFGIGQNITRQDMTVIMYRVANYIGKDISPKSSRVPTDMSSVDNYADDAVVSLYQAGIINGVSEGVFAGWQTATRAQAAKLCYDLREAK